MTSSFARRAHRKDKSAVQLEINRGGLYGPQSSSERSFLFRYAAPADESGSAIFNEFAREWGSHPVGRMGHGVSHQHQASVIALESDLNNEIAHLVATEGQIQLLDPRNYRVGYKALDLWFALEQICLRAGVTNKRLRPINEAL